MDPNLKGTKNTGSCSLLIAVIDTISSNRRWSTNKLKHTVHYLPTTKWQADRERHWLLNMQNVSSGAGGDKWIKIHMHKKGQNK